MVIQIQIWVAATRFRKDFSVCTINPKSLPHTVILIHVLCTIYEKNLIDDDMIPYLRITFVVEPKLVFRTNIG